MRTHLGLSLAATGLAVAAGLVNLSCSSIDCGPGTVEQDGTCRPADEATNDALCGGVGPFATVLGLDGKCEAEVPTVCDLNTTREEVDDQTGVTTCVGTAGGCMTEIQCSAPDAGKVTLCGRVWDSETDQPFAATVVGEPTMQCTTPTTEGPCSLRLRFFDALDFAMNPTGAVPIVPPDGVFQDGCNRYKGHNMTRPTFGFIGVAADDAAGAPARHKVTGVAASNAFATPGRGFRVYATRNTTDTMWSTTAGLAGQTFNERGVLAMVFRYNGVPRAGVQGRRNMNVVPADDYYFSDTGITRTTVAPAQDSTGANGTVLIINSPTPIAHDGAGAEPPGCRWPSNLSASIQGVTFMQLKDAETPGGAACP